jgi:hypothetical protein
MPDGMISPRPQPPIRLNRPPALPARPKAIRTSPDGLTIAAHYAQQWLAFTVDDGGAILQLALLDLAEVEGWTEWNPAERDDGDTICDGPEECGHPEHNAPVVFEDTSTSIGDITYCSDPDCDGHGYQS